MTCHDDVYLNEEEKILKIVSSRLKIITITKPWCSKPMTNEFSINRSVSLNGVQPAVWMSKFLVHMRHVACDDDEER